MTTTSMKHAARFPFASAALASAVLALGLAVGAGGAAAQDAPAPREPGHGDCACDHGGGPGHGERAHGRRTPAERLAHWQQKLARVSERLQLNDAQRGAAQRLLVELHARAEQDHATTGPRTPERREARQALMAQADARFSALLDARQRAAWDQLKGELRARHGGERGGWHRGGRRGGHGPRGEGRGLRSDAARGI